MDGLEAKVFIEKNLSYDEVKRLLIKLIQTPSPQTDLLEKEPKVLALISEVIKPDLESVGLRPVIDNKGNLITSILSKGKGKRLLLVGYAMNAAPSTMQHPYSGTIVDGAPYGVEDECIWGRGACEQKGSLAAMIAAIKLIAKANVELPADLVFVASTAGESGRHDSISYVLEHAEIQADWGIVDGPPEIQLANKGRIDILINIRGKQSHSSRPWEGINAVEGAVKALERIQDMIPYPAVLSHPKLGRVSLSPTSIESLPKATHTIPSECRILLDRRLLPGDDPVQVIKDLEIKIGKIDPFSVELVGKEFMYPSEVSEDASIAKALSAAIRLMLGQKPEFSYGTAANDTGFLNVKGIESVNYGSRNFRFQHTDHDLVSVRRVFEAAKVFAIMGLMR